jgi:hypothetical protein
MSNGISDSELRSRYEKYSAWAERLALLILVGLAVEIADVFILKKPWLEGIFTIAATTLIFAGVWGELLFEKRAKEAGDRLVAKANARAAEAQLELANFRLPRRWVLRGKTDAITERLRPFAGTEFDSGLGQSGEQADFWWDLEPIIVAAGWVHVQWRADANVLPFVISQGPDRPLSGSVAAANVEIHVHPDSRERLSPAATALISALNEAGIAARDAGHNTHNINTNAIHILIGNKE